MPDSYTIDDIFDPASPYYSGASPVGALPPSAQNAFTGAAGPATLASGELQGNIDVSDGFIESVGFVSGSQGWKISADGSVEFNDGTFRGSLVIGGTVVTITPTSDIQATINALPADGGIIYLAPGTWNVSSDIVFPDNVSIIGTGPNTIVDFGGTAHGFKALGTLLYNTGTFAISDGSNTVVGTGTNWTSAYIGKTITLGTLPFTIVSVNSTTNITIAGPYYGPAVATGTYVIFTPVQNIRLASFTIQNSTSTGLQVQYLAGQFAIQFLNIFSCGAGISLNYVGFPVLNFTVAGTTAGHGVSISNTTAVVLEGSSADTTVGGDSLHLVNVTNTGIHNSDFSNASGCGISITSCSNIGIENMNLSRNTSHGMELVSGNTAIQINQVTLEGNGGDGIRLTASSSQTIIAESNIYNNTGYGVNVVDSTSTKNTVSVNILTTNTSGSVNDAGTSTIIRGNSGVTDNSNGNLFSFGGTGADGALSVPSGTTTINLSNAAIVVKNYTSINIAIGATLNFSNPNVNGTVIIIKCQGAIVIAGTVDANGMGAAGGASVTGVSANGNGGNAGLTYSATISAPAGGSGGIPFGIPPGPSPASALLINNAYYTLITAAVLLKYPYLVTAGGGGSGGTRFNSVSGSPVSGAGGAGGGTLVIECAGAWNFTGTISVSGANGSNATVSGGQQAAAGGGGGGGGLLYVLYNVLTASSGSVVTTGGTGGNNVITTNVSGSIGGVGGASFSTAGNSGTAPTSGQGGGNGGAGESFVLKNTEYA